MSKKPEISFGFVPNSNFHKQVLIDQFAQIFVRYNERLIV